MNKFKRGDYVVYQKHGNSNPVNAIVLIGLDDWNHYAIQFEEETNHGDVGIAIGSVIFNNSTYAYEKDLTLLNKKPQLKKFAKFVTN